MSAGIIPSISLAIARLTTTKTENFAIWVTHSPLPGGYVHHDTLWTKSLTAKWLSWQEMFSSQEEPYFPVVHEDNGSQVSLPALSSSKTTDNYGGRLMQDLGIGLWEWLFDGSIRQSFAQSQGIAIGQNKPLRVRLEIHDPHLIALPWEIMQPESGQQALSLNPQILLSRTTSKVDPLIPQQGKNFLDILLVLGEPVPSTAIQGKELQLEAEAKALTKVLEESTANEGAVAAKVHTLLQPTPADLITALESGKYNVFLYAGHGVPAPDGGLLFLAPSKTINGTELAQLLVNNRIVLAVFNACWGAQPDRQGSETIDRSSLAEVLIHHGVPAVLAMRDSIADEEALSFIQGFAKSLTLRMPIDQAVRVARQQLVALYKFNQPAWTLPILYMHPQFDGELIAPNEEEITELPTMIPVFLKDPYPLAYLRYIERQEDPICRLRGGMLRVGRSLENDLVIPERWVSQRHAEIYCRENSADEERQYTYFLRDFSRFGTLIGKGEDWRKVHHQSVPLRSGIQLKFGSPYGQTLEFYVDS